MLLYEILDTPFPITWVKDSGLKKIAEAHIGGRIFLATFTLFPHNHKDMPKNVSTWHFTFVPKDTEEDFLTGTGNAHRFITTMYNIIEDAITQKGVQSLYVQSRLEPSRIGVFSRVFKRVISNHGWVMYTTGSTGLRHFWWFGTQTSSIR